MNKTTNQIAEGLTLIGTTMFEGDLLRRVDYNDIIEAADRLRLLDAQLATEREARRIENEFIGKAIETMAMRLADCNTRLSAELHDARMESHLLRLRLAEANNIGETPREGTA